MLIALISLLLSSAAVSGAPAAGVRTRVWAAQAERRRQHRQRQLRPQRWRADAAGQLLGMKDAIYIDCVCLPCAAVGYILLRAFQQPAAVQAMHRLVFRLRDATLRLRAVPAAAAAARCSGKSCPPSGIVIELHV